MLARRIPDFVHQVLNQCQGGPTGMLEVQSPPDEGPVGWVVLDAPPEPEEAFQLVPEGDDVRAVVTGELSPLEGAVHVEFHVYFGEDDDENLTAKVGGIVALTDPVSGLLQLARHLARILELSFFEPPKGLLTRDGAAFWHFLQGLENAMLLSGDLEIVAALEPAELMRPFAQALERDPRFGLALRVAHSTMAIALAGSRLDKADCARFLDRCYSLLPVDGEACVAVAEQLKEMGDDQRAIAWLQHATHLDPPPARGLENLGILFANRGDTVAARELWLKGIELDGRPDFFAHLARLYFAEERELDAWDMVLRGLRRLQERASRRGEWDDSDNGGVLLSYLREHLTKVVPPPDLVEALVDLCTLLDGNDQVDLGQCLVLMGRAAEARAELASALEGRDLDVESRDRAVRSLLELDVRDFERRFGRAVDVATNGRNPRACLRDFRGWLQLQPEFWPAMFFSAVAKRRLGETGEALDLLDEALGVAPDQPDILFLMAQMFDQRGNPKRALELIEQAINGRDNDARLHTAKVEYLLRLGRPGEAKAALEMAQGLFAGDRELQRLQRLLPG
jgi:tetratricopeptide (TPR) repeat protein